MIADLVLYGFMAGVLGALWYFSRPQHIVTTQKTVNVNQQPEVVTVQTKFRSLGVTSSARKIWHVLERHGLAAVSRMQSINEEIMEETAKESADIEARRARARTEREAIQMARRRKKMARRLGKPISEITDDMVRAAMASARPVEAVEA